MQRGRILLDLFSQFYCTGSEKTVDFKVKELLEEKIKTWGTFAATAVAVVITLVQFS